MNKNHVVPVSLLALAATWVFAQQGEVAVPPPGNKPPAQDPKPATPPPAKTTTQDPKTAPKATVKPPPAKTAAPVQKKPAAPKKAWQEFKLNPTTTMFLDFTESNPDAVISLFSRTSGITILKTPQFKTPLTLISAKPVKLDEAFEIFNTVLGMSNFELRKQGNLMLVAMKQPPQGPPMQAPPPPPQPVVKTYYIKNAQAAQVAKVITDIYAPPAGGGGQPGGGGGEMMFVNGRMVPMGGGGGAPGGANPNFKVTSDEYSNSIVVKAMPDEQTKIEALIKDLDKAVEAPTLVSEVFTLRFVPADQAVRAIEDVLSANAPTGRGAKATNQNSNPYGDYFYYNPYSSSRQNNRPAGGQSATAITQTNSVSVNASKENMDLVRRLIKDMDVPAVFADNTTVVKLMNAKALDVAELLTKVFAQQRNNNDNGGFFFFDAFGSDSSRNNNKQTTDYGDEGQIVNTREIQGKVKIEADPNTNSIVVVTQPSNMRMIQKVIDKLDQPAEQVVIETVVVEANLDNTTKLGVEYSFLGDFLGGSLGGLDFGLRPTTVDEDGNSTTTNPQGFNFTVSGNDYKVFLNAIQSDTRFRVLDTPRIFTSNNIKSTISVGQRLPVLTGTQNNVLGGSTNLYRTEDVAVTLTVTPRITANGQVTMEVTQTANDLAGYTDFNAAIINNREATTTVSVADGATVILGGIIRHTETASNKKVPVLGDIPLLGQLFRSTSKQKAQTELMVFLTPHVIRTADAAQKYRKDTTNELTKPSQDSVRKVVPPVKEP